MSSTGGDGNIADALTAIKNVTISETPQGPELDRAEYTYRPLQQSRSIRILILAPAEHPSSPLQCTIDEHQLKDQPAFEAISYVWGVPVFTEPLAVSGASPGTLWLTASLAAALRRFRHAAQPRALWADAACVNQRDAAEKSRQVALMGQIYRAAARVLVWLGPGDAQTAHVVQLLRHLASRAEPDYGVRRDEHGSLVGGWGGAASDNALHREALERVALDFEWVGADAFFSQDWFARLWVVQEVALGRDVRLFCGQHELAWADLVLAAAVEFRCVHRGARSNLRVPLNMARAMRIEDVLRQSRAPAPLRLWSALLKLAPAECGDPRDRVYALLSFRGRRDLQIWPDYAIAAEQVYVNVARALAAQSPTYAVAMLSVAGVATRLGRRRALVAAPDSNVVHDKATALPLDVLCAELPSWAPDWRLVGVGGGFHMQRAADCGFAAGSAFTPAAEVDPVDGALRVVGRRVDVVAEGCGLGSERELPIDKHVHAVLRIRRFFDERAADQLRPVGDAASRDLVFARTILADRALIPTRDLLQGECSHQDLLDLWHALAAAPDDLGTSARHDRDPGEQPRLARSNSGNMVDVHRLSRVWCYRLALRNLLNDRQLAFTQEGRVGLFPAVAEPGDLIVVVAGAFVPLVLRPGPKDDQGVDRYYVIGDCFVSGIMYGELKDRLTQGPWVWCELA